jgi:hypothetical protein
VKWLPENAEGPWEFIEGLLSVIVGVDNETFLSTLARDSSSTALFKNEISWRTFDGGAKEESRPDHQLLPNPQYVDASKGKRGQPHDMRGPLENRISDGGGAVTSW